jgi:hypothetical protein
VTGTPRVLTDHETTALANVATYSRDAMFVDTGLVQLGRTPQVGDVVWLHSRGSYRKGVVSKVAISRATVTYTTGGALKEGQRIYDAINAMDPDAAAASTAGVSKSNWRFMNREVERLTKVKYDQGYLNNFDSAQLPRHQAEIAKYGTFEAYAAHRAETARALVLEQKAANHSPYEYVKFTSKAEHFENICVQQTVFA